MVKKVITISLSLVLSLALTLTYIHFSRLKQYSNNNVIKAIPTDAFSIINIHSIEDLNTSLNKEIVFRDELKLFGHYNSFKIAIDSLLNCGQLSPIKQTLDHSFSLSFHTTGNHSVNGLLLYALKNKAEETTLKSFLKDLLPVEWNVSIRKYNTTNIYQLTAPKIKPVYISFTSGILVMSHSSLLIENSIRQVQSGLSFLDNSSFGSVMKTMGQSNEASVLLNFDKIPEAITNIFDRKYRKQIETLKHIGCWAELDISIKDDKILFNGFINATDNNTKINQIFSKISPQSSEISKVIPTNSNLILGYSFNNSTKLKDNLNTYLKNNKVLDAYQKGFKSDKNEGLIFSTIANEFALVDANTNSLNSKEGSYLIIQTNGQSKAKKNIISLFGKQLKGVGSYKLDNQTKTPIYENERTGDFINIFSHFIPYTPNKYFAFYENYIFFSDDKESLNKILYANILKKTIYYSKYNNEFLDDFSSKDNVYLFCDLSKLGQKFSPKANISILNPNKEQKEALSNFYGMGIQLSSNNNMLYANICLKYNPQRSNEPQTIWQSKLDSTIRNKPGFVKNHYTKQKEILVQDMSNKVYLITPDGRILWEKKLDKQILSDIHQVDYFKNNKLQYLFNTEDRIYLLDRNGNNVAKYPVNLANKATNGLALFDYDNNRNYRIFLATDDNRTSVYDIKGNKVVGWKPKQTEGKVTQEIQHLRSQNNDYIILADDSRNYILNRRGENRITLKEAFIRNNNSKVYFVDGGLVTTDTSGNLRRIKLDNGEVKTEELLNKEIPHYFTCLKNGGKNQYIIVTHEALLIYNHKYKKEAEIKVDGSLALNADIYQFSATQKKIGIYDSQNNKIYLINSDGSIYKNFPLRGSSRFSIGFLTKKHSNFNLVVGGENNYLYNYTVQ